MVPDSTMTHAVLLGRHSWSHFPVRKFVNINETRTVVTFEVAKHEKETSDRHFVAWVDRAFGKREAKIDKSVAVRYAEHRR